MAAWQNIIIATGFGGRFGSGHYVRCLRLKQLLDLKEDQFFCLTSNPNCVGIMVKDEQALIDLMPATAKLVILDIREPKSKLLKALKKTNKIILGLDILGPIHRQFDYVINAIPSLAALGEANVQDTSWLSLPDGLKSIKNRSANTPLPPQIVAFFSYNQNHLLKTFLGSYELLISQLDLTNPQLIIYSDINKTAFKQLTSHLTSAICLKQIDDSFSGELINASLFISHFGLSALEALHTLTPTLFWNPSAYHHKLTQKHFPDLLAGYKSKYLLGDDQRTISFKQVVETSQKYGKQLRLGESHPLLPSLLNDLIQFKKNEALKEKVLYRKPEGNFYFNKKYNWVEFKPCIDVNSLGIRRESYGQDYFFQEYLDAYGKTYEQDKANLYQLSYKRLNIIKRYLQSGRVLDIGCALGYFLDCAAKQGFKTYGVELSDYGFEQAKKKHNVKRGDFTKLGFEACFELISLWYVIEHFESIDTAMHHIAQLQAPNGILALSTPNRKGVTGRFSPNIFYQTSPLDHYYLFDPKSLMKYVESYGYKCLHIEYTGVYYKRFKNQAPKLYQFIPPKLYPQIAQFLGLGDTFEIYFQKITQE